MIYTRINDSGVLEVRVNENGESMVDLRTIPNLLLFSKTNASKYVNFGDSVKPFVRETVHKKISSAIKSLPDGHCIYLVESFRDYSFQKEIFGKKVSSIAKENPDLNNVEVMNMARKYVSDPDNFSPHLTGGAVDLTLTDAEGHLLDMGNWFEHGDSACLDYDNLTNEQQSNRGILSELMLSLGFVNYPYEWWHWSYGDKYWGYVKNCDAVYDTIIF